MPSGYCTVEDVRWALQEVSLSGALGEDDNEAVVRAIAAQTEWLEKDLKRHWYVPGGVSEDTHDLIPTGPNTRDDEESIPTGAASLAGDAPRPKTYQGDYTRIDLARRDAEAVDELLVRTADGSFEDWVGSNDYEGGTWPDAVGDDYYLRVNNGGESVLYLDTANFLDEDDEPTLDSFANAVYVTFQYGHEGLPQTIRRAVAFRAITELSLDDDLATSLPDDGQLVNVETKKQAAEARAKELLDQYR